MKLRSCHKKGFTLIEFILVIALSGIIFLALAQAVVITIRSFDITLAGSSLIGRTDTAYGRMMREIMEMKNGTNLITATASDIRFVDVHNNDIEYKRNGNQLMRNTNAAIDSATALQFEYFDKDGNPITTPIVSPQNTNVRMVRATLTAVFSGQQLTVRSAVKLRNVR